MDAAGLLFLLILFLLIVGIGTSVSRRARDRRLEQDRIERDIYRTTHTDATGMLLCRRCGAEGSESAGRCPRCGAVL